ncbi:hypothetical protein SDJN02_20282, partial [Cucurbita argyrosperma subsp. argyrosperma]
AKNIMRFAEKASGTGSGIGKSEAEKGQPMAEITSNQNQQPVAIDPENDEGTYRIDNFLEPSSIGKEKVTPEIFGEAEGEVNSGGALWLSLLIREGKGREGKTVKNK